MNAPGDMLVFAAVVREGSFTRAARALGVTKQAVSERIARLEAQLGVRLLERTTRQLGTTDAGAMYYRRCTLIAAEIEDANTEVRRRQSEPVGLLRVSVPVLYGRRFLTPIIEDYLRRHPKMRVEVMLADRRVDLIEEGFDVAIRIGKLEESSLTARKLGESHVYYVARPGLVPANARQLGAQRCIGRRAHETWHVAGRPIKIAPVLVVNDMEVACEAAIAGIGIARLPAIVCRDAVISGRLQIVLGRQPLARPSVYAVYPSRQYLTAKVRLFVDTLAALVAPMQPLE